MDDNQFIVNDFASFSEKSTDEYAINMLNNFWAKVGGMTFFNERRLKYREIRRWAEGLQNVQDLINQTTTRLEGGDPNSSWANLDYSPPSILPVFIDGMVGDFMSLKYKVKCNAIDRDSKSEKLAAKETEMNRLRFAKELAKIEEISGIPTPKPKFDTEEEIDVEHDNFKLGIEEAVEETVQSILEACNIESIQRQMFYDFINLKMAVVRCYYDINWRSKFEYIDPELYLSTASFLEDFSDVNLEGHIEFVTIGELKRQSGFSNEKLYEIAKSFAGQIGNAQSIPFYIQGLTDNQYDWFSNLVMVFHFEFLTIDNETFKIKENKYGKKRIYRGEGKGENALVKRIQNCYTGSWVVNSKYVYNYKLKENMIRERLEDAFSTQTQTGYFKFAPNMRYGENKSHTERAILFAKQWHLAYLKLQQFVAAAIPPGYKINIAGTSPVDLGNGKTEMPHLSMRIFHQQTGTYIYDSEGEGGLPKTGNQSPLEPFIIPIGEIERLMAVCNFNLEQIRQVCGRPVGVDTSTPSPETLVGVLNASRNAAMVSLEPIRQGFTNIMKGAINYLCMMVQDKATDSYGMAVGDLNVKLLEMGKKLQLATLGMDIEYEPDSLERQEMKMTLDYEVKSGRLPSEDALYIITLPNIKQMARVMKVRRKQYMKKTLEESQQNIKLQAQVNAESGQAVEQARQQTEISVIEGKKMLIEAETQSKLVLMEAQAKIDNQKEAEKHSYKLAEISLNNATKQSQPTQTNA